MIYGLLRFSSSTFERILKSTPTFSIALLIALSLVPASVSADSEQSITPARYPIIGLQGGYTNVSGYFEEKLSGGPTLGLFVVPWMWQYFRIDTELSWSYLNVQNSPKSYVMLSALTAGTLFRYPVFTRVDLFAGFVMRGSYLFFHGENSGETAQALKVGFGGTAGCLIRIYKGLEMRITYRFTENDLSGRSFMSHEVLAGFGYGFSVKSPQKTDTSVPYRKIKFHYNKGRELFGGGSFKPALEQFNLVRSLDAEHIEAANYIKKITSSLEFFERAAALKEKGDLFGAITLLKKCDRRMDSAQTELQNIREVLKSRIDALEKTMVDLYNKKKYPESINLGKKILLADPNNRKAPLYIRRARRRHEAYRKFQ